MGVTMVSALAAAIVAASSSSTTAKPPPALAFGGLVRTPVSVLRVPDGRTRTCTARTPRQQSGVVERNFNPVACEQPPRSHTGVVIAFRGLGLSALFGG